MQWFYKRLLFLMAFPFLGGCEYAVQTWVFTPDVQRETTSQCYKTNGIKLVPWANELDSEKKLKPLFKSKSLNKAQKKELIYSRMTQEEMADEDPLNPRHSGFLTIGLQNPISIPVTSIMASTELSSLKKEYKACMWKVTRESAWQNLMQQYDTTPLSQRHIAEMESEKNIIANSPEGGGVFNNKHPETYLPQ